jgi:hypothetical protein
MRKQQKTEVQTRPAGVLPQAEVLRKGKNADLLIHPALQAAYTIQVLSKQPEEDADVPSLVGELSRQIGNVIDRRNMARAEAMLITQAHTLDQLFNTLARKAMAQSGLKQYEAHMRLALKSQGQCRTTLETLSLIKDPRQVSFVRQANFANGPQQINNGTEPPRAGNLENEQSKLLERSDGERVDTRTTGAAIAANQELEAVGKVNRPAYPAGKGTGVPKPVQRRRKAVTPSLA